MSKKKNRTEDVVSATLIEEPMLVEFEEWFSARENLIPAHHHREIIKADFKARKVPKLATMDQFDEALRQYGVNL